MKVDNCNTWSDMEFDERRLFLENDGIWSTKLRRVVSIEYWRDFRSSSVVGAEDDRNEKFGS